MHNVQYSFVRLFHGRRYKKSVAIIRVQFSVAIGVVSEVELTSSMDGGERPQVAEVNGLCAEAAEGDAGTWATHGALPREVVTSPAGGAGRQAHPWEEARHAWQLSRCRG